MKQKLFFLATFITVIIWNNGSENIKAIANQKIDTALYREVTSFHLPLSTIIGRNMDVEAADIDNDGDLDIILAREFQPNIILINDGKGNFTNESSQRISQLINDSEDIGIADFDGDGDLDLLFTSEDNAVHEFYLNNGNGFFTHAGSRIPNSITNGLLVIDLNNDGLPDLILGNSGAGNPAPPALNKVYINNGDATFRDETSLRMPPVMDAPQDIKAGDIDNDGDPDLVFGNEDGNKILINNGSGIFTDETSARLPVNGNEETRKVTLADIDNDGDLDIFFANVAFKQGMNRQNRILVNNGSGFFTDETSERYPFDFEHTMEGIFIDVDFDGDLDLITANIFTGRPAKVFINDGNGFFTENLTVFPEGILLEGIGMKAADFNNNGLQDIFISNYKNPQDPNSPYTDKMLFRIDTATVGLNLNGMLSPDNYMLYQNYPNPFNPGTVISYYMPGTADVKLSVYDLLGREIAVLVNKNETAGKHSIEFNAGNLDSGIYFYTLYAGENAVGTKKMIVLK